MGLITPDFGKIKFNGTDITNYPVHLRAKVGIGYPPPKETSIFKEYDSRTEYYFNFGNR